MKTLKKIALLLTICFLASQCLFVHKVYAVDTYKVSTDTQAIKKVNETQYIIPLYLSENNGIMGFRIYLGCLKDSYKITSITPGLITSKGNFNTDNSAAEEQYYTSVLWNNVENVTDDGSLMYLAIETSSKDVKQIDIEVSYSQEDTFDEKWKDVVLSCDNLSISLENLGDEEVSSSSDIAELVNNKEEEKFLEQAESSIIESKKESKIGDDKVKGAVVRTLKKYDISSLSDIPEDKANLFWEDVKNDLIQNEDVKKKELKDVDIESLVDRISISDEDYYSDKYEQKDNNTNEKNQNFRVMIIVLCIIVIVLVLSIVIVVRKGRRNKNEE